jgi:hypothetical protein
MELISVANTAGWLVFNLFILYCTRGKSLNILEALLWRLSKPAPGR